MTLDSKIVNDTPAARRFRLLAPLAALLALAALIVAPGLIVEFKNGATTVGTTSPQEMPVWTASESHADPAAGPGAIERH